VEDNVVQAVADNAVNYKVVGQMMIAKRKILFWIPCVDLKLEDYEKNFLIH